MKEKYDSPTMVIVECEVESGFVVSSIGVSDGSVDNNRGALSNGSHSEWDDLW